MGIRFTAPEPVRIPISDGDYIVIKKRLSHGERDDMMALMMPSMTPGEKLLIDSKEVRTAKVLTYLIGWSSPTPMSPEIPQAVRRDTLRGLDPDTFDEIDRAIDTHIAAVEKEKNAPGGGNGSSAISPSPSAATGGTSGSIN